MQKRFNLFPIGLILILMNCQTHHSLLPEVVKVEVKGGDYYWHIRHAGKDGKLHSADDIVEVGNIHLPANSNIELQITSQDNLYFWTLEAFNQKAIALKNRIEKASFHTSNQRSYPIDAGQMCGYVHESLKNNLVVVSEEEYAEKYLGKVIEMKP